MAYTAEISRNNPSSIVYYNFYANHIPKEYEAKLTLDILIKSSKLNSY
jgi:hypothetical protein